MLLEVWMTLLVLELGGLDQSQVKMVLEQSLKRIVEEVEVTLQ